MPKDPTNSPTQFLAVRAEEDIIGMKVCCIPGKPGTLMDPGQTLIAVTKKNDDLKRHLNDP